MSDQQTGKSPFNFWWAISLGFVALVIVGLVVGLIVGSNRDDGNAAAPTQGASSDTGSGPSQAAQASDVCDLPAGSQDIPTAGPDATWRTDQYFKYPTSNDFGPASNPSSSTWGCYAHSPTGALFASANLFRGLGGQDYASVAKAAGVDNAALQQWIDGEDPAQHQQAAGQVAQIAGFQFQSVQPDAVVLNLGFQQSDVQAGMKISLVWDDTTANWKADFATSNFDPSVVDLSGYTQWGASSGS